jgi:DNA-binding transcriptional MerR regulator/methylmalonyl-CoA mutase cobalamin-binding subunit
MLYDSFGMADERGYLRIGELARRTGTSPELLRAWERRYGLLDPSRSEGGFRLYSDDDEARILAVKRLIADGLSASEAARAALGGEAISDVEAGSIVEELAGDLRSALDRFDEAGANAVLDRMLTALSVETVLQEILLPYLKILGDRWARGEVSVAQEHFASSLIRGRLLGLARGWGAGSRPAVVLACPPGEEHDLGLIIFGIVVSRRGWRVVYLGQDTPFATIEETVDAVDPRLVVLAVTEATDLTADEDALRRLAERVPVAVGGVGVTQEMETGLGLTILRGDPVEEGRSLSSR